MAREIKERYAFLLSVITHADLNVHVLAWVRALPLLSLTP